MGKLTEDVNKIKKADKKIRQPKSKVIKKITSDKGIMISAKVNGDRYALFKRINKILGVSNNSVINMLINDYIKKNSKLLDELED